MNYQEAYRKLEQYGQLHVLKYYDTLAAEEKQALLKQIDATDFSVLQTGESEASGESARGKITPLSAMELDEIEAHREEYKQIGLEAIRAGKVGAVLLAGGMGTRLGSDAPKGMYNIGLTRPMYIFERLIQNTMDVVKESGAYVPFFVMTSDKNHDVTVKFFYVV